MHGQIISVIKDEKKPKESLVLFRPREGHCFISVQIKLYSNLNLLAIMR